MKEKILLSIIIPAFNVSNYLERCIESVLSNSNESIELILVNDGSTDNTLGICKKYAKEDNRVIVISKNNEGVSIARNEGINEAKGKYLMFADADDYYEHGAINSIVNKLKKCEEYELIIFSHFIKKNATKTTNNFFNHDQFINIHNLGIKFWDITNKGILFPVWNKIYLKKIIEENNISFPAFITMGEDAIFNIKYMGYCKDVYFWDMILYNYVLHTNQSTAKPHDNYYKMMDILFDKIELFLKNIGIFDVVQFNKEWLNIILNAFYHHKFHLDWCENMRENPKTVRVIQNSSSASVKSIFYIKLIKYRLFFIISFIQRIKYKLIYLKKCIVDGDKL